MELRHLRYFLAVADEAHFTRAAAKLGIGQPPLSQQIQQLEKELGTPLFKRLARGVALTEAGHAFADDARRILREVDDAAQRAQRVARGELGRLRVGLINSAPFHPLIPRLIREFRRRYPNVAFSLEERTTPGLVTAVRNQSVDLAFVRPLLGDATGLHMETVLDEDLIVALPAGHALAAKSRVPLMALSIEPFVLFSRAVGAGLHDEIVSACAQAGFSPRVLQEASQVTSIVNLVASGLGVSIVPASMQHIQAEGVTFRPLTRPVPKARLSLICRVDTAEAPQVRKLRDLISELKGAGGARP
ncbi:DNA-binding transcriptional regulator, LysR family [Solimonas aquatica]|uniref:DNA-binding transcriptional regulator, LysR family n=1 Tax=Solimonas aquatica TaxID=489703 RepID=A0A1H9KRS6_9GAMM|nr:LysR family transcriptional regulator [Solimonas aquatica]SER01871.1 DNA-binding transcriptional regulator, LysR family [Solimonas aquatica]